MALIHSPQKSVQHSLPIGVQSRHSKGVQNSGRELKKAAGGQTGHCFSAGCHMRFWLKVSCIPLRRQMWGQSVARGRVFPPLHKVITGIGAVYNSDMSIVFIKSHRSSLRGKGNVSVIDRKSCLFRKKRELTWLVHVGTPLVRSWEENARYQKAT